MKVIIKEVFLMCQSMAYRCQKSKLFVSVFLVSVVQTITRGGNPAIPRNVRKKKIMIIMVTLNETRTFSSLRPSCLQHVGSIGHGAIVCKSHSEHRALITCNMLCTTWYERTAQLLSLTKFISLLFYLY